MHSIVIHDTKMSWFWKVFYDRRELFARKKFLKSSKTITRHKGTFNCVFLQHTMKFRTSNWTISFTNSSLIHS